MIVQSKIKAFIKTKGLNTGGDSLDALEKTFAKLLADAIGRAKANDRKTLMARDV